jgi:outer membrane protein TolC
MTDPGNIGQNTSRNELVANSIRLAEMNLMEAQRAFQAGMATQDDVDAAQAKVDQAKATETKP